MTGYIRSSVVILYTSMPPSNQYQYDLNEFHSETFTVCDSNFNCKMNKTFYEQNVFLYILLVVKAEKEGAVM